MREGYTLYQQKFIKTIEMVVLACQRNSGARSAKFVDVNHDGIPDLVASGQLKLAMNSTISQMYTSIQTLDPIIFQKHQVL